MTTTPSISTAQQEMPEFLRKEYRKLFEQTADFVSAIKTLVPRASFKTFIAHIKQEGDGNYKDDGNTPCPGTQIRCIWQYPFVADPLPDASFFSWWHGEGDGSLWFSTTFRYRNYDQRLCDDTFPSIDVGLWGGQKQNRAWHGRCGDFPKHSIEGGHRNIITALADIIPIVESVCNRNDLEDRIRAMLLGL